MKKLLIGILAVLACFACFAGCNENEGNESGNSAPSPEQSVTVDDAKKNVKALYQSSIGKGRFDYEVVNAVVVGGVSFSVDWTVTCDEGVVTLQKGDVKTTVVVNKDLTADAEYKLKATITAPDGTQAEIEFEGVVEMAPPVVPQKITEAPVVGTDYLLWMYQSTKHQDLYFTGIKSDSYLATTNASKGETYENGVNVQVETVEGKDGYYYLTFNNSTGLKQYIGVTNTYNNGSWHDNAILAENTTVAEGEVKTFEFTWSTEYETMIATLTGVKSGSEEATTETKTVSYFLGTSGGYYTFGACPVDEAADSYVGCLVTMVDKSTIAPADKVAAEKKLLSVQDTFTGAVEYDLPVKGTTYTDVAIAWEVVSGDATLENGKLTIANPTADATVVIKATLSCGNDVSDTAEFTITVLPQLDITVVTTPVAETAYKMYLYQTALGKNYYLTGAKSGNFLATSESASDAADVYAEVVDGGYKFYVKDDNNVKSYIYVTTYIQDGKSYYSTTIDFSKENASVFTYNTEFSCWCTVTSDNETCFIGTYNTYNTVSASTSYYMTAANMGVSQFPVVLATIEGIEEKPTDPDQGDTTLTTPEEIVNALYALKAGESLAGEFTLTGVITAIDSYSNPTIVVNNMTDKPIYCFKLKVTNAVGDTITVTAKGMTNYNGTYELTDCTLVSSEVGGEEGGEGGNTTEIQTLTISEALALGAQYAHDTYTTDMYYVTGKITEVQNTKYGNVIISDGTNSILVYGMYVDSVADENRYDSMATKPIVGDTVKLLSVVGCYSNSAQLKNALLIELTVATDAEKVAIEKEDLTLSETVSGATNIELKATGAARTDVSISWEVTAGSEIATISEGKLIITNPAAQTKVSVKATLTCGQAVDTKTLDIVVNHLSDNVVSATETFAIAANKGTLASDTLSISWSSTNFNFLGEKASSGTNIRVDDSDHFRVYAGSKFSITGKNGEMITKVVIQVTESKYASILVDSLTTAGVTAVANGTTVTLTVTSGSVPSIVFNATAQFRIKSFEITYLKEA